MSIFPGHGRVLVSCCKRSESSNQDFVVSCVYRGHDCYVWWNVLHIGEGILVKQSNQVLFERNKLRSLFKSPFFFFFLKTNRRPGYAEGLFIPQRLWNLFHRRSPVRPGYVLRSGYGVCRPGYGVLNCTEHWLLCGYRVLILTLLQ
jgi:hypothetical protein